METIIYLIRHSKTLYEKGLRNTSESSQIINEKEILSVEGEKLAEQLSKNIELQNLDVIWSSSYVRAKQTAKYIANQNNLEINLDERLNERKLGNMTELAKIMKDKETRDVSREQLLDQDLKTSDGESVKDTNKRMNEFFVELLEKYKGKRIAIISHGGAIKFFLLNYCKVTKNVKLEYKDKELDVTSPCLLRLTYENNNLLNIEQINN
ncbi:MAG: histidine phosphatase family protein [Clostridia bacterium]|nr:histidine phosphatase family protein [Clostridia bacterium]